VALILARIGAGVDDVSQLIPFIVRTWMYASGVIFSITGLAINTHRWAIELLQINPAAVYIALMRNSLMLSERLVTDVVLAARKVLAALDRLGDVAPAH